MDEYFYIGNVPFTQSEIDAINEAIEDVRRANTSQGIYALLAEYARRSPEYPEFSQHQIDVYLESKGLKSPDIIIPPRKLSGGYELFERFIVRGSILPLWYTRSDGAIFYSQRTWGTESPAEGWRHYAWFQVKNAGDYQQISKWINRF